MTSASASPAFRSFFLPSARLASSVPSSRKPNEGTGCSCQLVSPPGAISTIRLVTSAWPCGYLIGAPVQLVVVLSSCVTLTVWLGSMACAPNGSNAAAMQISTVRERRCNDIGGPHGGWAGVGGLLMRGGG